MSVNVVSVWLYSLSPIDTRPIIAEFCKICQSGGLRVTDSIELEQYADIAPGCRNKVQRLSVVHKSVVQAKRELRVNLNRVTYITLESQITNHFNDPNHDLRTMRNTMQVAENMGANFVPIVLHYDDVVSLIKQARTEGIDMVDLLRKRGLVEDVRGKPPVMLAELIYEHIRSNQ